MHAFYLQVQEVVPGSYELTARPCEGFLALTCARHSYNWKCKGRFDPPLSCTELCRAPSLFFLLGLLALQRVHLWSGHKAGGVAGGGSGILLQR